MNTRTLLASCAPCPGAPSRIPALPRSNRPPARFSPGWSGRLAVMAPALLVPAAAHASEWNAKKDGSPWGHHQNWIGSVPSATEDAVFPPANGSSALVVANNGGKSLDASARDLVVQSGAAATLEIPAGSSLAVHGGLRVSGNLDLSGPGGFSAGGMHLDQGTLQLRSFSAGVTIPGRLSGTGSILGNRLEVGGTLAPGGTAAGSAGALTVGNLRLPAGAIFEWDLTRADTTSGFDTVAGGGAGSLSIDSQAAFRIIVGGAVEASDPFWKTQQTWNRVFTGYAEIEGGFAADRLTVTGGDSLASHGTFSLSGTDVTWTPTFSAVPEPSTLCAGLLVLAGFARRTRRRG